MKEKLIERLTRYAKIDTQSDANSSIYSVNTGTMGSVACP